MADPGPGTSPMPPWKAASTPVGGAPLLAAYGGAPSERDLRPVMLIAAAIGCLWGVLRGAGPGSAPAVAAAGRHPLPGAGPGRTRTD